MYASRGPNFFGNKVYCIVLYYSLQNINAIFFSLYDNIELYSLLKVHVDLYFI